MCLYTVYRQNRTLLIYFTGLSKIDCQWQKVTVALFNGINFLYVYKVEFYALETVARRRYYIILNREYMYSF